jgi:AraC-like DNA-binding protein
LDLRYIVLLRACCHKRKYVAFVELTYYGTILGTTYSMVMNSVSPATVWPETLLRDQQVSRVFVCGREVEPPLLSHVVNFPRLEIPLAGCYENQIESGLQVTTVRLRPGDALFAPSNCWNLPTWRQPVRLMSVLFGRKQLGISIVTSEDPAKPRLMAEKFSQPRPLTGPVPKILEAMCELHAAGGPEAAFADLARALLRCLGELQQHPDAAANGVSRSLLEDICVFLQSHYQYDVTRDSVARHFGVSPNYLSRVFQVQGHMTLSNYLMHVRIDRAKYLLSTYNLKLDDVAARCGYHDTAYFCRVFKRLTKSTPAAFRAQHKPLVQPPGEDTILQ